MSAGVLPAGPLLAALELMAARDGVGIYLVCERVSITDRTVRRWRSTAAPLVTIALADRVLMRSPWQWFDIWKACRAHIAPADACPVCAAHARAARAFDSVRPGLVLEAAIS